MLDYKHGINKPHTLFREKKVHTPITRGQPDILNYNENSLCVLNVIDFSPKYKAIDIFCQAPDNSNQSTITTTVNSILK